MHPGSSCRTELLSCAVRAIAGLIKMRGCLPEDTGMQEADLRQLQEAPAAGRELMVEPGHVHRGPPTTLQTPYLSLHREQVSRFPRDRVGDSSL